MSPTLKVILGPRPADTPSPPPEVNGLCHLHGRIVSHASTNDYQKAAW